MAYLASRGDIVTSIPTQITSTSSFRTNVLVWQRDDNVVPTYVTSTYNSSAGSLNPEARVSANGEDVTVSRGTMTRSVTSWPDGTISGVCSTSTGWNVTKSFTTTGYGQVTTSVARYSGSQHCDPVHGTRKLCVRTGTGENDVVKYGLTTNTDAKQYCGLRMNIDGQTAYIGRSEERLESYSKGKNIASTRSTSTVTMTSTVSSMTSRSTYTSSYEGDSYSYSYSSYGGTNIYGSISSSGSYESTASGTSSWTEYRSSSWPYSVATSKSTATTWSRSYSDSTGGANYTYANSSYTSAYTFGSRKTSIKSTFSGNVSTKCNNATTAYLAAATDTAANVWYRYSFYETYSKSGRGVYTSGTYPITSYYTTSRTSTSYITRAATNSGTYIENHTSLVSVQSSISGSYTATSFEGYRSQYTRLLATSSTSTGVPMSGNNYSTGCIFSVSASVYSTTVTNQYLMTCGEVSVSSISSTNAFYSTVTSSDNRSVRITATSGNKSTFYSGSLATVSADENIFTVSKTGYYISKNDENFIHFSIYGYDQIFTITTRKRLDLKGEGDTSTTFSSVRYDRAHTYTTDVPTSSVSSRLYLSAGTYQYTSVDGRLYTASIPTGYVTRKQSGYSVTDNMATYSTSISESYSIATYTTMEQYQHILSANNVLGVSPMAVSSFERLSYQTTETSWGYLTRYYTRTSSLTMTQTDYVEAKKMLSHVTTGTRSTTYSTSRNTTYSISTLTQSMHLSSSWLQWTHASGTLSSTSSSRVDSSMLTTQTVTTATYSMQPTSSYYTNRFSYMHSSGSSVSSSTTITASSGYRAYTSVNGYTVSGQFNSVSTSVSTETTSTSSAGYTMQSISQSTSASGYHESTTTFGGIKSFPSVVDAEQSVTRVFSVNAVNSVGVPHVIYRTSDYSAITIINGLCAVNTTTSGPAVTVPLNGVIRETRGFNTTRSVQQTVTYTHVVEDGVGQIIYPDDATSGVAISSYNHSTYVYNDVSSSASKTSTYTGAATSTYLTTSNVATSFAINTRTTAYTRSSVSTTVYGNNATLSEYFGNGYVTSKYSFDSARSGYSQFGTSRSTWENEWFGVVSSTSVSASTATTSFYSASSSTRSASVSTYTRTWNNGTNTTIVNHTSSALISVNISNVSSCTNSSITSRTISMREERWALTNGYTYYSTYDSLVSSTLTSTITGSWSWVERFSSRTYNRTTTSPYVITSASWASHLDKHGAYDTNAISYMSLHPTDTTGNLCTYTYHTSSYYSSASHYESDAAVTHGFIYDSSESVIKSDTSATTYEIHYTGSEAHISAINPEVAFSKSHTSALDFNSFTHLVGAVSASEGLRVAYTAAQLSVSYLSYLTSSILQHSIKTTHNYNM